VTNCPAGLPFTLEARLCERRDRGPGFPRIVGGTIDIGAFELQTGALKRRSGGGAMPPETPAVVPIHSPALSLELAPDGPCVDQLFASDRRSPIGLHRIDTDRSHWQFWSVAATVKMRSWNKNQEAGPFDALLPSCLL
jgi:hypothetical protein